MTSVQLPRASDQPQGEACLPGVEGCLNLEATFPALRVRMSEDHESGHLRSAWHMELVCANGVIRPHGGRVLQAHCTRPRLAAKLLLLPEVQRHQVGDREAVVLFEMANAEPVVEFMRPQRRLTGRPQSRGAGFLPRTGGPSTPSEPTHTTKPFPSTPTPPGLPEGPEPPRNASHV